jgi:glutamine amidotransferase
VIVVVDYGMGNVGSILNMLRKIGAPACVASGGDALAKADKIVLPGVGAFDAAMGRLAELDIIPLLNQKVLAEKTPILGICLGMQLLTTSSEEGTLPGLGWLNARTVRFNFKASPSLRVPHMGWNEVKPQAVGDLWSSLDEAPRFYFVHSYHLVCDDPADVMGTTQHGYEFVSAVRKDNIRGTQFHPEKSHRFGLQLLQNFALCT